MNATLRRYRALTPSEQQVFHALTEGQPRRMIADALGISVGTAEFHRASVMKKMQAKNLADLTLARVTIQDHLLPKEPTRAP